MLDQSIADLQGTVTDLEGKLGQIDSEGNEWKTRLGSIMHMTAVTLTKCV